MVFKLIASFVSRNVDSKALTTTTQIFGRRGKDLMEIILAVGFTKKKL